MSNFNSKYNEQKRVAPCVNCKTRTPVCHGICNLYQQWVKEEKKHARQVKYMKKQHFGLSWNRTRY